IFKEAGIQGPPQMAEGAGEHGA
ncbi:MAG: hypothetical protein QOD60_413, partial [Solirubrobacterales bacterium]|nr:hypothetical protein [Solirubrobacterales bacterium]